MAAGTATLYKDGEPIGTVDLATGEVHDLGTPYGHMASSRGDYSGNSGGGSYGYFYFGSGYSGKLFNWPAIPKSPPSPPNYYNYAANPDPSATTGGFTGMRGTSTLYENGVPVATVDLATGAKYQLGTELGQMASSRSSSSGGLYGFMSANGRGATWNVATGWVATNGAQTWGAPGSDGYLASLYYYLDMAKDEMRYNLASSRYHGYNDNTEYIPLDEEEMMFIAMIVAEAGGESELYWKIVAHVIMNRRNNPQDIFDHVKNVIDVITQVDGKGRLQFDGLDDLSFSDAMDYLKSRDGSNKHIEDIISAVMPIYDGDAEDFTGGAQWYWSPQRGGGAPGYADDSRYKQVVLPNVDHDENIMKVYSR